MFTDLSLDMSAELALELYRIGCLKFDGPYTLKSGIQSPYYVDLRLLVSHPSLLSSLAEAIHDKTNLLEYELLCGVPYTALPIATALSLHSRIPMLLKRKEAKAYGTKKLIEGEFASGQKVLIIEDLITSGVSILETAEALIQAGLQVAGAVVILDREQGGIENLRAKGIQVFALTTVSEAIEALFASGKVDAVKKQLVLNFTTNPVALPAEVPPPAKALSFEERSRIAVNPCAQALFALMARKKTNLCVSADVTKTSELLALAEAVGPFICCLKTHVDILVDFSLEFVMTLKDLARKFDFMLFEDRKFADIGNTVGFQLEAGPFSITSWADVVNAHVLPGEGLVLSIDQSFKRNSSPMGLLLIAEMSSAGNLFTDSYKSSTFALAEKYRDSVMGFICQSGDFSKSVSRKSMQFVYATPGVQIGKTGDGLGQQYRNPRQAIVQDGCDLIIVGRGVYGSDEPATQALVYQKEAWKAYEESVGIRPE